MKIYNQRIELSEHFNLSELLKSQTAERKNIKNVPNYTEIENMKVLCQDIGEPIREHVRSTINSKAIIHISSGYRSKNLNSAIGGSKYSQHIKGEAIDFVIYNIDLFDLFL